MAKKAKKAKKDATQKQAQAAAEEAAGLFEGVAGASDGLYEVGARIGNHRVLLTVQSAADRAYQLLTSDLSADDVISVLGAIGVSLSDSDEEGDDDEEEGDDEGDDDDEEGDDDDEEGDDDDEGDDEEGIEISESAMKKIQKAQTPMKVVSVVVDDTGMSDVDTLVDVLEALRGQGVKALKGKKRPGLKKLATAAID